MFVVVFVCGRNLFVARCLFSNVYAIILPAPFVARFFVMSTSYAKLSSLDLAALKTSEPNDPAWLKVVLVSWY